MYNAAPWIERCLESVMSQTIDSWECVVVDNNSADHSLKVAKDCVAAHGMEERFVFLNMEENVGPGLARNEGMKVARGEYMAFLDADDWLDADAYKKLLALTADSPDLVIGAAEIKEPVTRDRLLRRYPPSSCFHLYRREFVFENELCFPPERSSEDSYFVATCILTANTWHTTAYCGYNIFQNPGSVSRRNDDTRYLQKLSVFERLISFASERNLIKENRGALRQIYFRKALVLSLREYLKSNRPWKLRQITDIFRTAYSQLQRL